jgi:hypothetical protein
MRALVVLALASAALTSPVAADPNCICRARGQTFELGQSTCLPSPKGPRIATCGMVLNNTSWQFSETPCVISQGAADALRITDQRGEQATVATVLLRAP